MHVPLALVLSLVLATGCGPGRFALDHDREAMPAQLAATPPRHVPGEAMTWEVFWQGVAIGRAELVADPAGVRCAFRTGTLASALASVRYELITTIEDGDVRALAETVTIDRDREQRAGRIDGASYALDDGARHLVPGGTRLHTLGSALLVLRAWSIHAPGEPPGEPGEPARPGYLWLVHRGQLYRLDVHAPVRDEAAGRPAVRVDAIVRGLDRSRLDVTLWLAANRDRTPLRITVETEDHKLGAELISSNTAIDPS